jgi:hypothetical protein
MKPPLVGWIMFASIVMLIVGTLDFFEGLVAIVRKQYFVVTANQVIVFNMTTWGWITLLWGIVLIVAGLALWSGASWARWFTIVVASVNILGQLSWLGSTAYPLWTLVGIGLSITVVFALSARWRGYSEQIA